MLYITLRSAIFAFLSFFFLFPPNGYALTPDPSLIHHWSFEESAGNIATDTVSNHKGTLMGGVNWVSGQVGQAIEFDGTTYMDLGTFDISGNKTVSMWVRPNNISDGQRFVSIDQGDNDNLYIEIYNGGLYASVKTQYQPVQLDASYNFTPGSWYHVVLVKSAGVAEHLYINGIDVGQVASDYNGGSWRNVIGGYGEDGRFNGAFDEFRVYNRALTAEEITSLYDAEFNGGLPLEDTTPPILSAGAPSGVLSAGTSQLELSLVTDEVANCRYVNLPDFLFDSMTQLFSSADGLMHSAIVINLSNGEDYNYYVRCADDSNNQNDSDYLINFSISVPDTIAPSVSITNLLNGDEVTQTVNIQAAASDNVAVAGVQFKLDGVDLGTEDTSEPFSFAWNTLTTLNGSHILSVVARDVADNTAEHAITVNINNTTPENPDPMLGLGVINDLSNYPMDQSMPKPGLNQPYIDSNFGTKIRRITDAGSGNIIKPMYSTIPAWNTDESYLILYHVGSAHELYDGRSYAFIRDLPFESPTDLEQIMWDPKDPDILYYPSNYNAQPRLMRYRVSTNQNDLVRDFGALPTNCPISWSDLLSFGSDPQFGMSWAHPEQRTIGLRCGNTHFLYDIVSDTVLSTTNLASTNAAIVAPSGNQVYLNGDVYDMNFNFMRSLGQGSHEEHASITQLKNGRDVYIHAEFDSGPNTAIGSAIMHHLDDATVSTLVGEDNEYGYTQTGTHISAITFNNPGYAAVSMIGYDADGQSLMDNELLLLDANTGDVARIGHHHSKASIHDYWAEPHVVISPSGTRVLFGSDWGGSTTVDTYVVELPAYTGDVPPTDTQSPSIPTGLNANAVSPSRIDLSWNDSSDDTAVTGYKVYRDGSYLIQVTGNSYSDTGLNANTSYSYTVNAFDAAGNESAYSVEISATVSTSAVDPTIVGHWMFEENSGNSSSDLSNNGHDVTLKNNPIWTTGINGNALRFNGNNSYAEPASPNPGVFHDAFTEKSISMWIKVENPTQSLHMVFDEGGNTHGFAIGYRPASKTVVFATRRSKKQVEAVSTSLIDESSGFVHVAAVYDHGVMRLYINGQLEDSKINSTSIPKHSNGPAIGGLNGGSGLGKSGKAWSGILDEVRMYQRVLSAQEALNLANEF